MKITYLILLHGNPTLAYNLIKKLQYTGTDFFVHVDGKSKEDFTILQSLPNVYFAKNRINVEWGDISVVNALISCCIELKQVCKGEMVVLLSGADYPVKSNEYIHDYLNKYNDINFITGVPILTSLCNWKMRIDSYKLRISDRNIATIKPKNFSYSNLCQFIKLLVYKPTLLHSALKIWLYYPPRIHPASLKPYGGELWWILPINTLNILSKYINEHSEFLAYHQSTLIPDEIVFNTLVYNLLERSKIRNTALRYVNWRKKSYSPTPITYEDFGLIKSCINQEDILFIRKIEKIEITEFINNLINF